MKKDKIIEYIFLILICIITFFNLFLPNTKYQTNILVFFLLIDTIAILKIFKISKIGGASKKRVILLITTLSVAHVIFLLFIGIFTGFYHNQNSFNMRIFTNTVLPYCSIVLCTEIIRQTLINKCNKRQLVLLTLGLIMAEITPFIKYYHEWKNLSVALELVGYIIFPAISTNLLCNYMVKRYGMVSNVVYRLITTLYSYTISILPNIYMFFLSVYRIIYPYLIFMIVDAYFEKNIFTKAIKNKKASYITAIISMLIVVMIVMLISCKFKYGMLVVGSYSMTGTLNKGDAVIYERYDGQDIEEGQVIIYKKENIRIIHKVEKIQITNGEKLFFTKGTNNEQQDEGYRTEDEIIGIVKLRVIGIGWPTIWVNDAFKK